MDSCDERVYFSPPPSPGRVGGALSDFPSDDDLPPSYGAATAQSTGTFEFDDGLDEVDTAAPFRPPRPQRYVASLGGEGGEEEQSLEADTVVYDEEDEEEEETAEGYGVEQHYEEEEEEEQEDDEEDEEEEYSLIREQVSWQKERDVMRCLYRDQPRLEAGDVWYLIDATWYRKWKRYVRWDTMIPRAARPGPIDNRPLLEDPEGDGESLVKANVQEMTDFYIITGEEWEQLLVWYGGGPTIGRPVIAHGAYNSSLSVEYRPLRLYVLKSSDMDNELECYYSKAAKLQQLVDEMCPKLDLDPAEIRVWDYHGEVRTKHLTKLERTLVVSNIIDNQKILFEEKDEDGEFPEKPQSRTVSYSSYGASSSSSWSRWGRQEPQPPGLAGLANLGNTCFMNSSLQSLSNTVPLTAYFLSGRYREDNDVHGDNPLSTGGKLAEQYAELLRAIWDGSHSSIAPRDFKSKLERFAPQFAGYQQHDSQELLAFLLDGLHEDLNKKKRNKPYVEATEAGGRPDPVVAAEAWANHRLRNDSIIVDWFQGQLKSCVTCPECAAVSVTFDPCMYFSLPLPMVTTRKIKITFVPRDGSVPTRYKVTVEKLGSIRDLKRALCKMAGIDEDTPLVVAEVWTHQFYQVYYSDKTGLDSIQENDVLYAYEMDAHDAAGEEEEEEDEEERPTYRYGYTSSYSRYGRQEKEKEVMKISVLCRKVEVVQSRSYYSRPYTRKSVFGTPLVITVRRGETYDDIKRRILDRLMRFLRIGLLQEDRTRAEEERAARAREEARAAQAEAEAAKEEEEEEDDEEDDDEEECVPVSSAANDYSSADGEGEAPTTAEGETEGEKESPAADSEAKTKAKREAEALNNQEEEEEEEEEDQEEEQEREAEEEQEMGDDDDDDEYDEVGEDCDDEYDEYGEGEGEESTEEEEDPALALFTMQLTDKSGQTDYELLADDGMPLSLRDHQTISLNWDLDALQRYYIEAEDNHLEVHESVSAVEEKAKKNIPLQDCFNIFSAEEQLGPEDQVYCSNCKEFRQSTKKMDVWRLPPILVIHLKRFSYKNRYYREKLDTLVEFPLTDLDLSDQQLADSDGTPAVYDLMAVSNHFGSLGGGHYTAFGKHVNDGKWYKFDDSHVSKVDESEVCSTAAYVLFYRRKDTLDWDLGVPTPLKYTPPAVEEASPAREEDDEEEEEEEEEMAEGARTPAMRAPAAEPPSAYEFAEEEEEEEEEEEPEGSFDLGGSASDDDLDAEPSPFDDDDNDDGGGGEDEEEDGRDTLNNVDD